MVKVSIIGASGYVGGELIRLLDAHPMVEIFQITSERNQGKFIKHVHPNLRKLKYKFISIKELEQIPLIFSCLPHGELMKNYKMISSLADKIIDLSADFRLNDSEVFQKWYSSEHLQADKLGSFVYGIPELHRKEMKSGNFISSAGCNATASILALYPLVSEDILEKNIVIEVKVGSSEAGKSVKESNIHPERVRSVRSYKPTGHRHTAEIEQELNTNGRYNISFSATAIDLVRGILATCHVFLKEEYMDITEKEIWGIYRKYYSKEPFIRIIKEKRGNFRYPDPKTLLASNYCDIGFEKDQHTNRIVIMSALDNLMKGAAGQAVQAMNVTLGFKEELGLEFPGLYLY